MRIRCYRFTHTGWVGLCPIYLKDGTPYYSIVVPRYGDWMWPWLNFNAWFLETCMSIGQLIGTTNVEDEIVAPILVTGQLSAPIEIIVEEEED